MECFVVQFIVGVNLHTLEPRQLYRCRGEKVWRYLNPPKSNISIAKGYYNIDNNVVVLEERWGL